MNKIEFMDELEHYLRHLTDDDRQDALEYYSEYIDDIGLAPDEDVCSHVGTPREVSRQIIAQTTERKIEEQREKKTVRGSGSIIWLVILGIFASPIALPLAIAAVVIILALVITAGAVVFSFFVSGAAMTVSGLFLCILSAFTGSVAQVLFSIGAGIFIIGLGILILMLSMKMGSGLAHFISSAVKKRLNKKNTATV